MTLGKLNLLGMRARRHALQVLQVCCLLHWSSHLLPYKFTVEERMAVFIFRIIILTMVSYPKAVSTSPRYSSPFGSEERLREARRQ